MSKEGISDLTGSLVAIVTPFRADGSIDRAGFARLARWHVESGSSAIVAVGTTGESPTLDHGAHNDMIALAIESVEGKIPIIAGTGSNSTKEALDLTREAARLGASGAMVVNPYYNKPTQEGIYRHFMTIADSVDIPIIIYNIPARTSSRVEFATLKRLLERANIVGVKDATGDIAMATRLLAEIEDLALFAGDDLMTLPLISIGARGVISVVANIVPDRMARLTALALAGEREEAARLNRELEPLMRAMSIETNPIPVKTALAIMGRIEEVFRAPLYPMEGALRADLAKVLASFSLTKSRAARGGLIDRLGSFWRLSSS